MLTKKETDIIVEPLELRMYSLVMYNLSPIQQGIQSYHATIEATQNFGNPNSITKIDFDNWAKNWKTVIILNGGSSVTMEEHFNTMWEMGVGLSYFREPDLNDSLTAISFVVDERVFNKKKYPDFVTNPKMDFKIQLSKYIAWEESIGGEKIAKLRTFLNGFRLA